MNFEATARSLIEAVGGILSNENIDGVVYVLNAVIATHNDNWEKWITQETNDSLAIDKITCDCGKLIIVERTPSAVYADVV